MNQKSLRNLSIALGVLLLASVFYIFSLRSEIDRNTDTIVDVKQSKSELESEVDSLELELSDLKALNVKQDSTMQATYLELESKNAEIQSLLNKSNLSVDEIRSLRAQVNALKSDLSRYKSQIHKLQQENEGLRLANDSLYMQNLQTSDTLSQVRGQYATVSEKYQQSEDLVNNTLSVSNFNIVPIKVRNNGKEIEKTKAKRVDKLKVDFKLDPSTKASSGNKTLYVSIYKPDGSLAKFDEATPGSFTDKEGQTISYSDKITVPYNSSSGANVHFDWDHKDFKPGTYKINIYQNGFKIGQEQQILKL